MELFYIVTGALLGVSLGIGLALRITVTLIMRSNDVGDYSGTCDDFGRGVQLCEEKDGMREKAAKKRYASARRKLERRREAVVRRAQSRYVSEGVQRLQEQ
ncbi:MAG: hypothetical protein J5649_01000 [Lachnospiraceae bacterium]|nr:hypothetical protein [Lachnospiraceae bacterium]